MPTSMGLESWYRATELLGMLGESPEALGVAVLSERLELPKSTVARYLSVLGALGFVQQSPGDTRYRLGPTLYVLGRAVPLDTLVRDAAHPHLVALTERTEETSMLVIVSGTDGLCVEKIECTHAMRLTARVGERVPLHCGGSPRCLLAFLPDAEREAYLAHPLEARSSMTLTDPAALRAEAVETRAQGYVVSRGQLDEGMISIAAPVWDGRDVVIAAISIAGPEVRLTAERLPEAIGAVCDTAAAISMAWRAVAPREVDSR